MKEFLKVKSRVKFSQNKSTFTLGGKCGSRFKLAAFTLAEVLIVLGIIGVVAAFTIPVLMQHVEEKSTVTKLKQTYSIINNAIKLAINDNGTINEWMDAANSVKDNDIAIGTTLTKYLKLSKLCGE